MCVSALAAGDDLVRFVLNREFFAKKLSVERYSWTIYGTGEPLPQDLKLEELEYHDMRFVAWLRDRSKKLLQENEFASAIHHRSIFKQPVEFLRAGEPLSLRGIELHLECRRSWWVQTIREDVSHGLYDHLKQEVLIPVKEFWTLQFDSRNWQEIILEIEDDVELRKPPPGSPGSLLIRMILYNLIFKSVHTPAPPLDEFIDIEETIVEPRPATPESDTAKVSLVIE